MSGRRMGSQRLRAMTGDRTFAVDIDADRTRVRLRSETDPAKSETAASKAESHSAVETAFQIAPLDADIIQLTPAEHAQPDRNETASRQNETAFRAHVIANGDTTWVFIDGETFTVDIESAERARPRRGAAGNEGLAAPMPATVIKVLIDPGAEVHRGDVLLLLEAMKMELPVRAPRDGRVKALHCRPGELVQPGTPLVDLE
jgi:biotin carboxyl carrier protein